MNKGAQRKKERSLTLSKSACGESLCGDPSRVHGESLEHDLRAVAECVRVLRHHRVRQPASTQEGAGSLGLTPGLDGKEEEGEVERTAWPSVGIDLSGGVGGGGGQRNTPASILSQGISGGTCTRS